jgi:hypothetical protein
MIDGYFSEKKYGEQVEVYIRERGKPQRLGIVRIVSRASKQEWIDYAKSLGIENPFDHKEPIYYYHVEEVKPMMTTNWAPDETVYEPVKEVPDNKDKIQRALELIEELQKLVQSIK